MKAVLLAIVDLADVLNMEPGPEELSIEFSDRVIISGLQQGVITDAEADEMANYLNGVAP